MTSCDICDSAATKWVTHADGLLVVYEVVAVCDDCHDQELRSPRQRKRPLIRRRPFITQAARENEVLDMTPEGKVKAAFTREAKRLGLTYVNQITAGVRGVPDKLILPKGGRPVFAEFKSRDGKLSIYQVSVIAHYQSLGYEVVVIDTEEDAKNLARSLAARSEL